MVEGEAAGGVVLLDEVHGDEEISPGPAQVVEGLPGGEVAEVAGEEATSPSRHRPATLLAFAILPGGASSQRPLPMMPG